MGLRQQGRARGRARARRGEARHRCVSFAAARARRALAALEHSVDDRCMGRERWAVRAATRRAPSSAGLPAGVKLTQLNGVVKTLPGVIGCCAPASAMMLTTKKQM